MMTQIDPKLVSGSQWVLSKRPDGPVSTVLCVTNLTLKAKTLEEHPPQVVTITESGKILSHEIESFLSRRDYVGQNEFMANQFQVILDGEPEEIDDEDETNDIDSTDVGVDPAFEALLGDSKSSSEDPADDLDTVDTIPVFIPAVHDGLELDAHFLSYAEAPGLAVGSTCHIVRFSLDSLLNIDHVKGVFEKDFAGTVTGQTLGSFIIDSQSERIEMLKFNYVGTFLEVDPEGNNTAAVYLSTNNQIQEQTALTDTPVLHTIPQLSTSAAVNLQPQVGNLAVAATGVTVGTNPTVVVG